MSLCESCKKEHDGSYASGRFCSKYCRYGFCRGKPSWNKGLTAETSAGVKAIADSKKGVPRPKWLVEMLAEMNTGRIPWNKGLTTETSEKVKSYGEKGSVSIKAYYKTPEGQETRKRITEQVFGENNCRWGKSLYDVWFEKYGKEEADKKYEEMNKKHAESITGDKNHKYGMTLYDIWLKKYSIGEAKLRNQLLGEKISKANMGRGGFYDIWLKKYGKEEADRRMEECVIKRFESTQKAIMEGRIRFGGNGINGIYRFSNEEILFGSTAELSFVLGCGWDSTDLFRADMGEFCTAISLSNGLHYYPDFWNSNNETMYEIKALGKDLSDYERYKIEAGKEYCLKLGCKFELKYCHCIPWRKLLLMRDSGEIVKFFHKKHEDRYNKWLCKFCNR